MLQDQIQDWSKQYLQLPALVPGPIVRSRQVDGC